MPSRGLQAKGQPGTGGALGGVNCFANRYQGLAVAPPNDEECTWLVDLDKDGKQDILMHHPFTLKDGHGAQKKPPGTEPHRVTVLIGR